jgi:LPPG:FO 2-phospho-L-lactate transferase
VGRILALCGGVGGAKLAYGLARASPPEDLVIAVNTGDDFEHLGLLICPDLDTVTYTLAGIENAGQGWGREGESRKVLDEIARLGGEDWFFLGDKDIALHLLRRRMRDQGFTLTQIAHRLAEALGVRHRVLPMSDDPVRTLVETGEGVLAFQEYFVRRRCAPPVRGLRYAGADKAKPSPALLEAFDDPQLSGIVICPSNPYLSIDPMLAIPPVRQALAARRVPALAVSPIIGGRALKGPAAKMMAELGIPVSSLAIARHYGALIDGLLIDEEDRDLLGASEAEDPKLYLAKTVMKTREDRIALARDCLALVARQGLASAGNSAK